MLATLASEVKQIYDCTIFDIFIGNEYLPVAIVEAEVIRKQVADETAGAEGGNAASESVHVSGVPLNEPVLNAIAQNVLIHYTRDIFEIILCCGCRL